jgi:hypothetical protein
MISLSQPVSTLKNVKVISPGPRKVIVAVSLFSYPPTRWIRKKGPISMIWITGHAMPSQVGRNVPPTDCWATMGRLPTSGSVVFIIFR